MGLKEHIDRIEQGLICRVVSLSSVLAALLRALRRVEGARLEMPISVVVEDG